MLTPLNLIYGKKRTLSKSLIPMSYMKSLAVVSKQTTTALSSLSYCALIHRVDVTDIRGPNEEKKI